VLAGIAPNEGNLDAATAWDDAAVSLGYQQWSMHVTYSGPALLARLKAVHPEAFDAVVRSCGYDAGDTETAETSRPIAQVLFPRDLWRLAPGGRVQLNHAGYTNREILDNF